MGREIRQNILDKFVKIVCPDKIITGIGFESDQNLQNWRIKNPKGLYILK